MNSPYSVPNASRQHFRNTLKSKLFLTLAILSVVYTVLSVGYLIFSTFAAGLQGYFTIGIDVVFPILSIVATVGLFNAYSAARSGDSERIVSGLRMTKCYTAGIIIILVAMYILSSLMIICAGILSLFGGELADIIQSEIIDEIPSEALDIFAEFGDITTSFIAAIFFIAGLILLTLSILGSIYRRGISKALNAALYAEMGVSTSVRISGFTIVFGYILGVIVVIGGLDITNLIIITPLSFIVGIIDSASSIVLGAMLFILSLILSSLRSKMTKVVPEVQKNCPKCGSPMPSGAAFCMQCGASPYAVPQATEVPVSNVTPKETTVTAPVESAPAAPETEAAAPEADTAASPAETAQAEVTPEAEATVEEAPATVYCSSCGKPMPADQTYCSNCGFKLK